MPTISKTPLAKKDLKGIWKYIADDNPERATNFLKLLEAKIQMLANSPMMGKACDQLAPSLRFFPVGNYIIFYRLNGEIIEIIRVLHGAQDISDQFFN